VQKIPLKPFSVGPVDAARLMGISRARVYQLKNTGELPSYLDGRRRLFLVADIEARIARLKSAPPSIGPLLPPEARKLARRRVRNPEIEPLLTDQEQQIAVERASEPEPPTPAPIDQSQPTSKSPAPVEPPIDLARIYFDRLALLRRNVPENEARARAYEYTVGVCRAHYGVDLETAKRMVRDALKQGLRPKEPAQSE
jgi:hypothetical protein